jgi:hypothetical protein
MHCIGYWLREDTVVIRHRTKFWRDSTMVIINDLPASLRSCSRRLRHSSGLLTLSGVLRRFGRKVVLLSLARTNDLLEFLRATSAARKSSLTCSRAHTPLDAESAFNVGGSNKPGKAYSCDMAPVLRPDRGSSICGLTPLADLYPSWHLRAFL